MLFLDPESRIYYRKVIGRDDFIRIEPLDDQQKKSSINMNQLDKYGGSSPNLSDDTSIMNFNEISNSKLKKTI